MMLAPAVAATIFRVAAEAAGTVGAAMVSRNRTCGAILQPLPMVALISCSGRSRMRSMCSVISFCRKARVYFTAEPVHITPHTPFEVVKIRMQQQSAGAGVAATARQVVQAEGALGLYTGLEAYALRRDVVLLLSARDVDSERTRAAPRNAGRSLRHFEAPFAAKFCRPICRRRL